VFLPEKLLRGYKFNHYFLQITINYYLE